MADARTFVKLPSELMGAFNKRLLKACEDDEVTSAALHVIDGEPVVTLFSEIFEATAEDVAEAKDEDPDSDLKEGDDLPENPPIFVQVARTSCLDDVEATKSQDRMEKLYARAGGQVVKLLKDSGSRFGWYDRPGKKDEKIWGEAVFSYMAVIAYIPDDEDDDQDGDDESEMENNLRGAASA
jgi:hypothetical protein